MRPAFVSRYWALKGAGSLYIEPSKLSDRGARRFLFQSRLRLLVFISSYAPSHLDIMVV